ncbi:Acb2/Tad1 domain-containing protein [Mycobacteroides abscessus]|uniref:Acb2/Tad1 domain-containing protein n=1 Tax=Mycobacteroides abscessus TaxID=36809 RepID=UPI000C2592A1
MNEQLENNFKYHAPTGDKVTRHEQVREKCKELAYEVEKLCPNSRERSLALTKIEEAMMWANAAIARNE